MKEISVIAEDRVGLLADISYILGKAKVNIDSIAVSSVGGKAVLCFMVKNAEKATKTLESNGFKVSEANMVFLKIEDKPGALSEVAKKLADNKINVDNLYLVSKDGKHSIVGVSVSRPRKAKKLLSEFLIENVDTHY